MELLLGSLPFRPQAKDFVHVHNIKLSSYLPTRNLLIHQSTGMGLKKKPERGGMWHKYVQFASEKREHNEASETNACTI